MDHRTPYCIAICERSEHSTSLNELVHRDKIVQVREDGSSEHLRRRTLLSSTISLTDKYEMMSNRTSDAMSVNLKLASSVLVRDTAPECTFCSIALSENRASLSPSEDMVQDAATDTAGTS